MFQLFTRFFLTILSIVSFFALFSVATIASEENDCSRSMPENWHFTGQVQLGAAAIKSDNQLYVDSKNKSISNIHTNETSFATLQQPFF